jgi:hypothetical protein
MGDKGIAAIDSYCTHVISEAIDCIACIDIPVPRAPWWVHYITQVPDGFSLLIITKDNGSGTGIP